MSYLIIKQAPGHSNIWSLISPQLVCCKEPTFLSALSHNYWLWDVCWDLLISRYHTWMLVHGLVKCISVYSWIRYARNPMLTNYVRRQGLLISFTISFRVTSLALGQSYDCPSASEGTMKGMSKWLTLNHQEEIHWKLSHYGANFVVSGGTSRYHYDNLQCHQWWQSWHHDNSQFQFM